MPKGRRPRWNTALATGSSAPLREREAPSPFPTLRPREREKAVSAGEKELSWKEVWWLEALYEEQYCVTLGMSRGSLNILAKGH